MTAPCNQCGTFASLLNIAPPNGGKWIITGTEFGLILKADMTPRTFELWTHRQDAGGTWVAHDKITDVAVDMLIDEDGVCAEGCSGDEPCVGCSEAPQAECDATVQIRWHYHTAPEATTIYGLAIRSREDYDVASCVGDPVADPQYKIGTGTTTWEVLQEPGPGQLGEHNFVVDKCATLKKWDLVLYDATTGDPNDAEDLPSVVKSFELTVACEMCCKNDTQEPE